LKIDDAAIRDRAAEIVAQSGLPLSVPQFGFLQMKYDGGCFLEVTLEMTPEQVNPTADVSPGGTEAE
jgi:hypothetical protein